MPEYIWDSPPPKTAFDWDQIAQDLRGKPMEWVQFKDRVKVSVVNALRQGSVPILHPDLGFQVEQRNTVKVPRPPTCNLWLRYNPDQVRSDLRETIESTKQRKKA
jgi:hypothetical protein